MTVDKPSQLVPKLRFPEFQNRSARDERIGNVCKLKAGDYIPASDISEKMGADSFPCYGGNGFRGYVQSFTHEGQYVLIGRQGALCGNVNLFSGKFHATEHALVATPRSGIDTCWLYYALDALKLNRLSVGQAQPGLSVGVLKDVGISVPIELAEQKRVSDCLGSLDNLIAAQGRKLEALRRHKQGLMQQLFPRPGETVPRLRFPEFRDSSGWKTGRCRDIANVLPGFGFPNRFQGNKKGQFPFYKVSDISRTIEERKHIISEARNYIESDVLDEIRGKPVPAGTIIFAKIGEAIRSNRRVITTKPAVIDNNTAGVKAIEMKCSDEFLFYLWSNVSLIDHAGGVVPAVSKSALENVPLCYPNDPEEQQSIADCLGSLDDLIEAEGRMLDVLRHHKQGLMQQLFPSLEAEPR